DRFHETKLAAVKRADKASSLRLRLAEIALVFVRLDHVASVIINVNHSIMWATENLTLTRQFDLTALYFPGGRYFTVFFVAWSTSSRVISTFARDSTAPLALTANDRAAASTLLGRSTMITKSLLPQA